MKSKTVFFLLTLFSSLVSCDPPVTFSDPQPQGSGNETAIPKKLQGYYVSREDSSDLVIHDHAICRVYEGDLRLDIRQSDSSFTWDADSLLDVNTGLHYAAVKRGDSIFAHIAMSDTLFAIGESGVLRKFRGHYFLNRKHDDGGWEVSDMTLRRGILTIGRVREESEVQLLKEISSSSLDTVSPFRFSPTRREFKRFLNEDGFRDREEFVRQ